MATAIERLMRRLGAIGHLTDQHREVLKQLPIRMVQLTKGQEIVPEGKPAASCCLVVDGLVHRTKVLSSGRRQIFSLHLPGDMPDLHSLHLPSMDHSLVATTRCEVGLIPHDAIREILRASPSLTDLLWRDTLIDAAAFRAWMLMIGQAEVPTRMAHLFCELFVRSFIVGLTEGWSFPLPVNQVDLADMLGTSAVHANRTLQELRVRNLIKFESGWVTIPEWQALAEFGLFDSSYLHPMTDRLELTLHSTL
nr:Crp/Fnr family transcriptional regulator [uncultured Devosia sp.]